MSRQIVHHGRHRRSREGRTHRDGCGAEPGGAFRRRLAFPVFDDLARGIFQGNRDPCHPEMVAGKDPDRIARIACIPGCVDAFDPGQVHVIRYSD